MQENIKQQVNQLGEESQSIFSRMKKIKEEVASVNSAIQQDDALKADSDLLDKMLSICDELGLGSETKTRHDQNADCQWCSGGGGK